MKRDPRGFQYALDQLRSKCEWDLQHLLVDLARLNEQVTDCSREVQERETSLNNTTADLARRQGEARIIYVDKQQIANAYLSRQATQLQQAHKALSQLEAERDLLLQNIQRLQKFTDELEDDRNEEIKDYIKVLGKAEVAEADDAWLRGIERRAAQ